MRGQLLNAIDNYLLGYSTRQQLEDWLIANLQSILNSGDQIAIEIANNIDADFVEFDEGLLDELTLRDRLQKYFSDAPRAQTIAP
ncbi:MAG: hypothetical protein HY670_08530 [Chloroflexi bacterium]|nr:hypothetical protein [Chloroflexota bacterium]